MIYDERTGELFKDDGTFLKTVHCPYALRPENLLAIHGEVNDRACHQCKKVIRRIDHMVDDEVERLVSENSGTCVFATPAARHVRFLRRAPAVLGNVGSLRVIRSVRNLPAMQAAQQRGFKLLFRSVGAPLKAGPDKFKVWQHAETGAIDYSGDYRSGHADAWYTDGMDTSEESCEADEQALSKWKNMSDWFWALPDLPFPLGAYLIPPDLAEEEEVFVEDVLEDIFDEFWNQGNADRRAQSRATWTGGDLVFPPPEGPTMMG